ncbi:reverse transcriptase domain-containing protein (plasmid) [Brevibacillus halotolerans]|nr:reverse transcriptase domain-containing protein [Brevibacillus halotolerans]
MYSSWWEPICEAKFHPHSYGFRPNRGTKHAIARANFLININKLHYVVDIDIKGFFENVNHAKLIKQLWTLGIRDKNLICVLSKLLKAPVEGMGKQNKGTPKGGIVSPLLSNIVLNEFDWWISSQWETFETKKNYGKVRKNKSGGSYVDQSHKYRALRSTTLKEVYIVRYADDFKLFCRDYKTAQKVFIAVKQWLKERLGLDISPEKSKVINLRKNYSQFLGIMMKAKRKGNGYVTYSHISDKARIKITNSLRERIKEVQKRPDVNSVGRLNATILGMQNYYKVATNVNIDFSSIEFSISKALYNRFRKLFTKDGLISKAYSTYYKGYGRGPTFVRGIAMFPISGVKNEPPSMFIRDICNYTVRGRELINQALQQVDWYTLKYLMENPVRDQSVEYNDNRISRYVAQKGLCQVMKTPLKIGFMHCHHKIPKVLGGTDAYSNLIFLDMNVHRLIHATDLETINRYRHILNPNNKQLGEINKLRKLAGNIIIE